jgi:hypothetical protein
LTTRLYAGKEVKRYMTNKTRFTTAIATGAVLVNALAPIALANTVDVTGNGAFSDTNVNVSKSTDTVVNQTNNADISNKISSDASTGGNDANFNTGGSVTIKTGDAATSVALQNAANVNKASLTNCDGCNGGATDVTVTGNGAFSDNTVGATNTNSVFLDQTNNAKLDNYVNADSSTGKNDAKYNTGGDNVIVTGDADTVVSVNNEANKNFAEVGGVNGAAGGSSVLIKGNGADSVNAASLNQNSAVVLGQDNTASVKNVVDADAKTGYNDSKFNTGGFTGISTGDATTGVSVDNSVNFNKANLDCDCVLDGTDVKVAGNGADSSTEVEAVADNAVFNDQLSAAKLFSDVDGDAKTGGNDLKFSTGDPSGDPVIYTGNSDSTTVVENSGNVNVLGDGNAHHSVNVGNMEVGTTFDLSGLWAFFHGMIS